MLAAIFYFFCLRRKVCKLDLPVQECLRGRRGQHRAYYEYLGVVRHGQG